MSDLKRSTIAQLKQLLLDEDGTIPARGSGKSGGVLKDDIIRAIINNRSKNNELIGPDYLSTISPELITIISIGIPISDIPNLCTTNKLFRSHCLNSSFWSNYFASVSLNLSKEPQEILHMIFIELAKHNNIDIFDYLWNTEIIIRKIPLIKERRSLYESVMAAIKAGNDQIIEYIWSIDWIWMNESVYRDLWLIQNEDGPDYVSPISRKNTPYFIVSLKLNVEMIEIVKTGDFRALDKFYISNKNHINNIKTSFDDVLSYSPTVQFLNRAINLIEFEADREDQYEKIVNLAIKEGNVDLVNQIENIFPGKYHWLYVHFLQSPRSDSIKLINAVRLLVKNAPSESDGDAIGYLFGNKDIMLTYINKYPRKLRITLMRSFKLLTSDELIDRFLSVSATTQKVGFRNKDLSEEDWGEWIDTLYNIGYDYLLSIVRTKLIVN